MRRSVTPVVPPRLYRHFAVATLLLTATVAMFAEGENRQAQAASAASGPPAAAPPAMRIAASHQAPQPAPDWWEVDSSSDAEIAPVDGDTGFGSENGAAPGDSPDYAGSLSESERELLLAGTQESGLLDPRAGSLDGD